MPPRSPTSQARDELLADGAPHRAAHEREVHHRELERWPSSVAAPTTIASVRPVFSSASASRSRTAAGRRSRADRPSGHRRPPRRTSRRRRATRSARATASGSGGRSGRRRRATPRARRRGSASRSSGRCSGASLLGRGAGICSTLTSILVSVMATDLRPLRPRTRLHDAAQGGDELVEGVRRGRSGRGAPASAPARACSSSRLIQTIGSPSSFAGRCRGRGSRATWTCRAGSARVRAENSCQCVRPACRSRSRPRRPSRRTGRRSAPSTRRSGRGRSSRGSRAASRGRVPPRAPPRTSGNGCQRGSDAASPPSSPGGRAEPAHRLGHHLAVGAAAVLLELRARARGSGRASLVAPRSGARAPRPSSSARIPPFQSISVP